MRVRALFVAGLPGAAAPRLRDLRMDKGQRERGGVNGCRFTQPGTLTVDLQAKRSQKSRLAVVEARQRLIVSALAARVDDQQARALPRVKDFGPDEGDGHSASMAGRARSVRDEL